MKQILNSWATQNRIMPQCSQGSVTVVLEAGLQTSMVNMLEGKSCEYWTVKSSEGNEYSKGSLAGWRVVLWYTRIDSVWWPYYRTMSLSGFKRLRQSRGSREEYTLLTNFNRLWRSPHWFFFFFFTKISLTCEQSYISPWFRYLGIWKWKYQM